jgi:hypothetical protein
MITATSNEWGTVKVNGLCNKGEQFGDPWLIVIGNGGYTSLCLVVIANDADEAMDIYADSNYVHLTQMATPPPPEEEDWYSQLGNSGEWHDLSYTTRNSCVRCTVNYFAKADSLSS